MRTTREHDPQIAVKGLNRHWKIFELIYCVYYRLLRTPFITRILQRLVEPGCDYRESAFWVRGLVDQRGPEAALGALTVVTAIPCAECSSEASETGHTCFTNDAGDLAAEVASAASTEDAVDQWQAPRTRKMPSFDLEEVEDLMGEVRLLLSVRAFRLQADRHNSPR